MSETEDSRHPEFCGCSACAEYRADFGLKKIVVKIPGGGEYTIHPPKPETFVKADAGKPDLIPWLSIGLGFERNKVPAAGLEEVVRVLDLGARKYAPGNWALCTEPNRYYAAAIRHIAAVAAGEEKDPESGESPITHAMCCLLFARELLRKETP